MSTFHFSKLLYDGTSESIVYHHYTNFISVVLKFRSEELAIRNICRRIFRDLRKRKEKERLKVQVKEGKGVL